MRKIDVMIEKYQASDGKVFDDEDACKVYESGLDRIGKWFSKNNDDGTREVWYVVGMNPPEDEYKPSLSIAQYAWGFNEIYQEDLLTPEDFDQFVKTGKVEEIDIDRAYNILIGCASRQIDSLLRDMIAPQEAKG